jgi:hypothetical protein
LVADGRIHWYPLVGGQIDEMNPLGIPLGDLPGLGPDNSLELVVDSVVGSCLLEVLDSQLEEYLYKI